MASTLDRPPVVASPEAQPEPEAVAPWRSPRLLTRVGLLVDTFQHRCFDRFGLLFIDYSVLRVLQLSGPPYRMSPTELAEMQLVDDVARWIAEAAHRAPSTD